MFFRSRQKSPDAGGALIGQVMQAINSTHAIARLDRDGMVVAANENFLNIHGYRLEEITGEHHSIFVGPDMATSAEYTEFWDDLDAAETLTIQFKRFKDDGTRLWINATYTALVDDTGTVTGVLKTDRDISAPRDGIEKISIGLVQLSEGNLDHRVGKTGMAGMDKLACTFNQATEQLQDVMATIKTVSAEVNETIKTVDLSSDDLSIRTGQQAATLEQIAATLEELTAKVRTLSNNAMEAEMMTSATRGSAATSEKVMGQSIQAMADIQNSSNEISKIITVIDDIAFQTNLLAVNAGVEAARAKDAGSGFAVVATEVRSLAQRSQEAAGEIKKLISQSSAQVKQGVAMVNGAADELKTIIGGVTTISDKISEIAVNAAEQAETLSEINSGVSDLDHVTQQNAGMVDDVTNANKALSRSLEQMSSQLEMFKAEQSDAPEPTQTTPMETRIEDTGRLAS